MARRKEPIEIGEDTGLGIDIDGDGKSDFSIEPQKLSECCL